MSSTSTRSSKCEKTSNTNETPYELIYKPGIPGRGEHIRLALEEAGATYKDTAHDSKDGMKDVLAQISTNNVGDASNPPPFAPPILKHGSLTISQTPNILFYLGPQLGLVPDHSKDPNGIYHVNALTLTALDGLSNEAHATHHPIASGKYYEEQKDEAKRRATDYLSVRIPKFLGYFKRVLSGEVSKGGEWLYGGQLTYADLVLFQCLDGLSFAFPKYMKKTRASGEYEKVFGLYDRVKGRENVRKYLEGSRRQKYSTGIYRHYPELDEE